MRLRLWNHEEPSLSGGDNGKSRADSQAAAAAPAQEKPLYTEKTDPTTRAILERYEARRAEPHTTLQSSAEAAAESDLPRRSRASRAAMEANKANAPARSVPPSRNIPSPAMRTLEEGTENVLSPGNGNWTDYLKQADQQDTTLDATGGITGLW